MSPTIYARRRDDGGLYQTRILRRYASGQVEASIYGTVSLGKALSAAAREIEEAHRNIDDVFDVAVREVSTNAVVFHAVKHENGGWEHVAASPCADPGILTP